MNRSTGGLTTVVEFTGDGAINTGNAPTGLISDGAGFFWGTTYSGGQHDDGTVFKVNANTGALTTLVEFTGLGEKPFSGSSPNALLVKHSDGNWYGTTRYRGPGGGGTIFRLRFGPTPVTLPATFLDIQGATLNGTLNPNGNVTAAGFEWGTDPGLATASFLATPKTRATKAAEPVSVVLRGLRRGTTYYYRLRATNAENAVPQVGAILSFTTDESRAITPPTLTAPSTGTTVAKLMKVAFNLPSSALPGSVHLTFIDEVGNSRVLILATSEESAGEHRFLLRPRRPTASTQIADGVAIPDGNHTVTLSYRHDLGYAIVSSAPVLIKIDTTPPVLELPDNLLVTTPAKGVAVAYSASAIDAQDPHPVIRLNPPSGSILPIGITNVTVRATDAVGNVASGQFRVMVLPETHDDPDR